MTNCGCNSDGTPHEHVAVESQYKYPSLYNNIDVDNVVCLNEKEDGSIKSILKPQEPGQPEEMQDCNIVVSSDGPQLIIHIPFNENVKIKYIHLLGLETENFPAECRLFKNRDDIDFCNVDSIHPTQAFYTIPPGTGMDAVDPIYYPLNAPKFSNVHSLVVYFPSSFGGKECPLKLTYISIHGVRIQMGSKPVATVYELRPQLADHHDVKQRNKMSYDNVS